MEPFIDNVDEAGNDGLGLCGGKVVSLDTDAVPFFSIQNGRNPIDDDFKILLDPSSLTIDSCMNYEIPYVVTNVNNPSIVLHDTFTFELINANADPNYLQPSFKTGLEVVTLEAFVPSEWTLPQITGGH